MLMAAEEPQSAVTPQTCLSAARFSRVRSVRKDFPKLLRVREDLVLNNGTLLQPLNTTIPKRNTRTCLSLSPLWRPVLQRQRAPQRDSPGSSRIYVREVFLGDTISRYRSADLSVLRAILGRDGLLTNWPWSGEATGTAPRNRRSPSLR
jgi:hypothetical protein